MSPLGKKGKRESALEDLFARLDAAREARVAHRDAHRTAFARDAELTEEIEVLEAQIKGLAQASWRGKPSGTYTAFDGRTVRIEVAARWKRIVDVERLEEGLPDVAAKVVRKEVKMEALDALVESGELDADAAKRYIRLEAQTPSVSFKQPIAQEETDE